MNITNNLVFIFVILSHRTCFSCAVAVPALQPNHGHRGAGNTDAVDLFRVKRQSNPRADWADLSGLPHHPRSVLQPDQGDRRPGSLSSNI